MKISLTRIAIEAARKSAPKRLPGETHEFKQLIPAQYLAPNGSITSSRKHEVSKADPLLQRIRELETENKALRQQLDLWLEHPELRS